MRPELTATKTGVRVTIRAKPRASRSRVLGVREGALEVAIAAPPVEGAANDELVRTLAAAFGVPKSAVKLVSGQRGKHKVVEILGWTLAAAEAALVRNSSAP